MENGGAETGAPVFASEAHTYLNGNGESASSSRAHTQRKQATLKVVTNDDDYGDR